MNTVIPSDACITRFPAHYIPGLTISCTFQLATILHRREGKVAECEGIGKSYTVAQHVNYFCVPYENSVSDDHAQELRAAMLQKEVAVSDSMMKSVSRFLKEARSAGTDALKTTAIQSL
eukprot:2422556-Pleurochrysis_carterae.AAC.1